MKFEDLTPQQKEKALSCTTPEELMDVAKSEGLELTDEQLEGISGGLSTPPCGKHEEGSSAC